MLAQLTTKLSSRTNLSIDEMNYAMDYILSDKIPDEQKADFLQNLTKKGETDDELYAMLGKMDEYGIHIAPKCNGTIIDVCGTGGDRLQTFNISTTASFVIAAAGGYVAKHGNRSVSGVSGSADIFEFFGYDLLAPPQQITSIIEKSRIGFLFAQKFHPAMKNVAAARKLVGGRTAFNLLGPLSNPARVKNQLIGVFSEDYSERIITILKRRGAQNIMTVHSKDGLDELSTTAKNLVCFFKEGKINKSIIEPQTLGLHKASIKDIQVSSKHDAVKAFLAVLNCTANRSMQEITMLNAAGGLIVANIANRFDDALSISRSTLESGKAYSHFVEFIKNYGDVEKIKELELR
ncbi:MAG: anthranilate phosphoribosyltransferase [Nitrososphaera sp.]|jgi:anthranilate phosphoribosyltransferase